MHPQTVLKPLIYSRPIQAKLFIYSIALVTTNADWKTKQYQDTSFAGFLLKFMQ